MPMVKAICVVLLSLLLSGCDNKVDYEVLKSNPQFVALLMEQQRNPEAFGMRIMNAQVAYVAAKKKVRELENQHAPETDIASAKQQCKNKYKEVKMLLAVVGVATPD